MTKWLIIAGLMLLTVSPAFADEMSDRLKAVSDQLTIAQISVQFLMEKRGTLESEVVMERVRVKLLSEELAAAKKELESKPIAKVEDEKKSTK